MEKCAKSSNILSVANKMCLLSPSECELCKRLLPLQNRHQFVDVRMATSDGFVQPAVPSLHNVVHPGRGGMHVPHGWRKVLVEPRGIVVRHESVHTVCMCDRVLVVPSRWRHCYNDDTVFFNYFTFIYSFVRLGHELYYIMLLLVSYCIFPVQ